MCVRESSMTDILTKSIRGVMLFFIAAALIGVGSGADARPAPESFADLAEELTATVVNISTEQVIESGGGYGSMSPRQNEQFRQYMDRARPNGAEPRRASALGSGFIIDAKGFVITNNHVIENAEQISVNLSDGTIYDAKVIGTDPKTDIAVLKIKPKGKLPQIRFGDSGKLRVGDWVLAIGNPFGLGGTVTAGIVSARNRELGGNASIYADYIQTDASINRGNSGGPLFDMDGKVVGMNTSIMSMTGGSIGIGFAIPSEVLQRVSEQLIKYGEARRGWLGVRVQDIEDEAAGAERDITGAVVSEVTPGGPGDRGGIKVGDIIVEFDGKKISRMLDLPRVVGDTRIGKKVKVKVLRKGKPLTLTVTVDQLKERSDPLADLQLPDAEEGGIQDDTLGLRLTALTPALRMQYQIGDEVEGVLVTGVSASSPVAGKLQVGDVVAMINYIEISDPDQLVDMLNASQEKGGDTAPAIIRRIRRGETNFVRLRFTME